MRVRISLVVICTLLFGLGNWPSFAQTRDEAQVEQLKSQIANLPMGVNLRVRLKDHRELRGQLSARTDQDFQIATPDPVTVRYEDLESVKQLPVQSSTSGHPRLNRNVKFFLITFGVGAVLLILVALDLRKA